jgi:hypothetical protein
MFSIVTARILESDSDKAKYGSFSEVNEVCYLMFEDWEQVEAPRFDTILCDAEFYVLVDIYY